MAIDKYALKKLIDRYEKMEKIQDAIKAEGKKIKKAKVKEETDRFKTYPVR
jgi:uncharacterized membrane protein (DUF106 family)